MMGRRVWTDIEIGGRVFPTLQAAADHFGCTPETVVRAIRTGRTHRLGSGTGGPEACPVRIRGIVDDSPRAAARALGVGTAAIWQANAQNRIDRVGLGFGARTPFRSRRFAIGGLSWPSMRSADIDLGFPPGTISRALRTGRRGALEAVLAAAMRTAADGPTGRRLRAAPKDEHQPGRGGSARARGAEGWTGERAP